MALIETYADLASILARLRKVDKLLEPYDALIAERAILGEQALQVMRVININGLYYYEHDAYYMQDGELKYLPLINAADAKLDTVSDSGIFPEPGAESAEFGPNLS